MKKLIFSSICLLFFNLNAQRANNWYFGTNAGLNFSTTPASTLSTGLTNSPDNTSTISDMNGNLLFYTNGINVWNSQHAVMPNGWGLVGHTSAGQCALIVPIPCDQTKYVIFHVTEFSSPGHLNYSVVDMSLNGGLGDVISTQKNMSLGSGWTEKLCAYYNATSNSYWLLTHKWNSNHFVAFEINSTSIATNSVVSAIGSVHNCGSYSSAHDAMGQLTISPDGTKVLNALTCQDHFELFQFNAVTGVVSNSLSISGNGGSAWGTAFSPDSKKIYVNSIFGNSIFQYDINVYNQSTIQASQYTVVALSSGGYNFGYMELGPDSKLYIARPGNTHLSVVNNPNSVGAACNFSLIGQSLGNQLSNHGLSRIAYNITSNSGSAALNVVSSLSSSLLCSGNSATLTASGGTSYTWSPSGSGSSLVVSPSVTTTYSVYSSGSCGTSSAAITVSVSEVEAPIVGIQGPIKSICKGQSAVLTATGAATYSWNSGQTTAGISVSPTVTTTYTVSGFNTQGCMNKSVFTVSVNVCQGLSDHQTAANIKVYPNPVASLLSLEFEDQKTVSELQIHNSIGERLYTIDRMSFESMLDQNKLSLDVNFLSPGIYLLQIKSSDSTYFYKLIKE